ncbi:hypothetical protein N0V86_000882 [Didymella sp. IMI 355093]|nr:hypothetical protein N0V86_000882 [Didymella sp. IMI 355093]
MATRTLVPRLAKLPLCRNLQTAAPGATSRIPNFAFAFDIDGVLVRSSDALPRAQQALSYLQAQRIPFILLTNGGGKHESERVADLSRKLRVPLDTSMFVQSHTPFADMDHYKNKTVMVVGGDEDKCRHVAEAYGFKTVVTPGDILAAYPDVWPFSQQLLPYYKTFTRPLPAPIEPNSPSSSLRIDAVFVYNDPRDWGLDAQIIKDVLLSERGIFGTLSAKNGNATLPNKGYQQDGQPTLYFSNPDLLWAAKYHLPRLGQGGFREALEGIWAAITGGEKEGVKLQKVVMGKPYKPTYEFAEKRLIAHRAHLLEGTKQDPGVLKRVYMVGDNPASDIAGGNNYDSPYGTDWASILVKTGVYVEGSPPAVQPRQIVGDVWDAVVDLRETRNANGCHDAITEFDLQQSLIGLQSKLPALPNSISAYDQVDDMYDGATNVEATTVFASARDKSNGQTETLSTAEAVLVRLFGNLPDLIRLSEQLGKFDGQVVFIGHPNRDISAHQWSSSSFEWVNIGRYSHSRGKLEGSLASDRLRGIEEPHDTMEYFKLAAENRQMLIVENGRPKNLDSVVGPALHARVDLLERPQVSKDPSMKTFRITDKTPSGADLSFHQTTHTPVAKDVLEDPFVAAAGVSLARSANGHRFQVSAVNSTGSLDFSYRFPTKMSTDVSSVTRFGALSLQNLGNTSELSSTVGLKEVAFGEEAATRRGSSLTQDERLQQLPSSVSYLPYHDHPQILTKAEESRVTLPWCKDIASGVGMLDPATRPVALARSMLSASYTTSNLSATAAPYLQAPSRNGVTDTSETSVSTVNASGPALHYSDSDGLRKTQQYEVANGLTQQAPTAQSFKGPFFTDSKPTTHDPTVSLSVHVSEEEKLVTWFRDGHRSARQKEYTKSLIAAAVASDKSRYLGAIGEAPTKSEDGPYANTGPFSVILHTKMEARSSTAA